MAKNTHMKSVGELVGGRYEVVRSIGAGSFAEVYLGVDSVLRREVAIKLMNLSKLTMPGSDDDELRQNLVQRFLLEAHTVARLRATCTVTLFDFGEEPNGDLFMVLEYVPGHTLRAEVEEHGPMAPERVVRILRQVLSSLHEAHAYELLHRDLKPENIMIFDYLNAVDQVRVVDFGIAKPLQADQQAGKALTGAGMLVGTPRYVPPERVTEQKLLPASDIYGLGAVAYFCLTGEEIYSDTKGTMNILGRQIENTSVQLPAAIPNLSQGMRAIIDKMLHKKLEERYATAAEVIADIDRWSTDQIAELRVTGQYLPVINQDALQRLETGEFDRPPQIVAPPKPVTGKADASEPVRDDAPTEVVEFDPDMFD